MGIDMSDLSVCTECGTVVDTCYVKKVTDYPYGNDFKWTCPSCGEETYECD